MSDSPLERVVGTWEFEPFVEGRSMGRGRATFDGIEGGAFLLELRTRIGPTRDGSRAPRCRHSRSWALTTRPSRSPSSTPTTAASSGSTAGR